MFGANWIGATLTDGCCFASPRLTQQLLLAWRRAPQPRYRARRGGDKDEQAALKMTAGRMAALERIAIDSAASAAYGGGWAASRRRRIMPGA